MTQQAQEGQYEPKPLGQKEFVIEYEQVIRGKAYITAESAADATDGFQLSAPGQIALKIVNVQQL